MKNENFQLITTNRKATHEFFISERLECGIALKGTEIKSLREHRASLNEAYCRIKNGEVFLIGSHIPTYEFGGWDNHIPERDRKLLLHKSEIRSLKRSVEIKGMTLVPLKMYFNDKGKVKVEIGLAKGKQLHDKRAVLAEKDGKREIERLRKGNW